MLDCSVLVWDGDGSWIEIKNDLDYMDAVLWQIALEKAGAVSIIKIDGMPEKHYIRELVKKGSDDL